MIKTRNIRMVEFDESLFDMICDKILIKNCKAIAERANEIKKLYLKEGGKIGYYGSFYLYSIKDDSEIRLIYNGSCFSNLDTEETVLPKDIFEFCLKNGLYVKDDECCPDEFKELQQIAADGADILDANALCRFFRNENHKKFFDYTVSIVEIKNELLSEKIDLNSDSDAAVNIRYFLDNCDYTRARIPSYDSRWYMNDESQGHWELWTSSEKSEEDKADKERSKITLTFDGGVIARNPLCDVRHNAVVGIDFGTKSTVVAVQDNNDDIALMRVGIADYSKAAKPYHYENPTVMEFIDLNAFYKNYSGASGRPYTSWDDLKISHAAFRRMINSDESAHLESFVYDLKQWAGGTYNYGSDGTLIIKDQTKERYDIKPFLELTSEDINPIELYAYYLGLYINNQHTGIFLDYILSFPETYPLEVKKAILSSFEKGIKKAIPDSVFMDESCAAEFRVRLGASEPAAYAACALESFGIEPDADGVRYAVFDFGGGTTDFDYGVWKLAEDDDYYYDKILKHFGSGGDKTLGGENILQLMSYYTFIDSANIEEIRKNKIVFTRPSGGKIIPGTESMIKNDEAAILNTKQVMEVIRPIWEEDARVVEGLEKRTSFLLNDINKEGNTLSYNGREITADVFLFDETGSQKISVKLKIDYDALEALINERIEKGVSSFFTGMEKAFENTSGSDIINIFLAGNSSKSNRVRAIFEKYMSAAENADIDNEQSETHKIIIEGDDSISDEFLLLISETESKAETAEDMVQCAGLSQFRLFPPLGTPEAVCIQNQNGVTSAEDAIAYPTGKTGVAFGLIMCREGGGIKIESETNQNEQIKTTYYIGSNYRKSFKLIFDRTTEYNVWKRFNKALPEMETFEFLYTQSLEVAHGNGIVKNNDAILRKKCIVNKSGNDAFIYFRFISPSCLEYVIADENGIDTEQYISNVYQVEL